MVINSYATLSNSKVVLPASRPEFTIVDAQFFKSCLRLLIDQVPFDETWYLRKYPDIAQALENGDIKSAKEHYLQHGYFENRLPFQITVDEQWYLRQYADVREACRKKVIESAQTHFEDLGFSEGRFPYPHFALSK